MIADPGSWVRAGWAVLLAALGSTAAWAGAAAAPVAGFDDPPVVFELISRSDRFEADGTGTSVVTVRARPLSEAGVQQLGQVPLPYLESRTTLELDYLRVVKPDGTTLKVDRRKVLDRPAPVAAAFPVYSDLHVLHVPVPALAVGDTLEYQFAVALVRPDTPGNFGMAHVFEHTMPVTEEILEVDVPAAVPVLLRSREGIAPTVVETGDRRIYRWKQANSELDTDEIERPDVELSSFGSWDDVGRWYIELAEGRATPGRRVNQLADEITREASDDRARLEALFQHVSREYRYLGLSLGVARYRPQRAAAILDNGYGDCKDKHTLLEALARALGFEAYPVLVSSSREVSESVPALHQFDHMITLVRLGDELIWLDSTSQVTPFGYLSDALRGKRALVVGLDGASSLLSTPDTLPFTTVEQLDFRGEVAQDGALVAEIDYRTRGDDEFTLRNVLFASPPAVRDRVGKGILEAAVGKGFDIEEFSMSPLTETDRPLELRFKVRRADYMNLLSGNQELDFYLMTLRLPEVEEDEPSLTLERATETRADFRVSLPAGFTVEAPAGSKVTTGFGSYTSEYSVEGRVLSARRTISTLRTEIQRQEYREYQAYRSTLRADDRQKFEVRQGGEARSARASGADVERLVEEGVRAIDRKDYDGAITALRSAVEARPEHAKAWQGLGRALVHVGQIEEGVAALRKQTELDPYLETAFSFLGWALDKADDQEGAEGAYRRQIEIYPLDAFPHAQLGRMLADQDRCEEAVGHLDKAVSLKKSDSWSRVRLGGCLLVAGQGARGESILRELLETSDSGWELGVAGHRAWNGGRPELAVSLLTRATQLDPRHSTAFYHLGRALLELDRLDEAVAAFRTQVEIDPDDLGSYELRATQAVLLTRADRCADAIPIFEQLVAEFPRSYPDRWWLAVCHYKLAQTDEALAAALEVLPLAPEDAEMHNIAGRIYAQKGDYAAALRHLEIAAKNTTGVFEDQDMIDFLRGQIVE